MTSDITVVGSYLSPYVRKVLVCLELKGLAYRIDPIVAFYADDRFTALNPVRRIPVLIDDRVTLPDSSVICQYLEDRWPEPPIYPRDVADRARARWLEEYADTRIGDVFIWKLFNRVAIGPAVWGEERDRDAVRKILAADVPAVLDELERQLPAEGFVFGELSIADVAIGAFFRNLLLARATVDAARWPRTAGLVGRVHALPSFAKLARFEDRLIRTPVADHRAVLAELGAPLAEATFATPTPRRGVLSV